MQYLIGYGINARPSIHDVNLMRLRIGVHYHLYVSLVFLAPLATNADQRLTATRNGCLTLRLDPRQHLSRFQTENSIKPK